MLTKEKKKEAIALLNTAMVRVMDPNTNDAETAMILEKVKELISE